MVKHSLHKAGVEVLVADLLAGPHALALLARGKPQLAERARAELVAALERLDRPGPVGEARGGRDCGVTGP